MKKEIKRKAIICAIIGVACSLFLTGIAFAKKKSMVKELAGEVFRFHVLANSDSTKDQELKLKVKESVITYMKTSLPESDSVERTKEWAKNNLLAIEKVAQKTIVENGYAYAVHAEVTTCDFPEKVYGDVTFPAGEYEALRVEIGEAKGQNWWCVLYPNLCFIDAVKAVVPQGGKEELKGVLEEDTYDMITDAPKFRIRWFFFQ